MDQSFDTVLVEYDDERGVGTITMNRPDALNALNGQLRDDIIAGLKSLEERNEDADGVALRAVVLEGAGEKAFCAGADIGGFSDESAGGTSARSHYDVIRDFPAPVIAKIDGYCLGGGLELALACDLRVATDRSSFGTPEISLGLIPGGGGTQRLTRILGETRAKELVFRGNHIDADRAEEWGLINRSVERDEFDDTVEEFVSDLAGGPPIGLKIAKKVMNEGEDASMEAALAMESQGFGLLTSTEDVLEGTAAFAEDRDPEFEGK